MDLIEIDHIFLFIRPDGPEPQTFAHAGLKPTYRRQHPGQGTANVCYAFENLFLELLWIESAEEATSLEIRRTGLFERSNWQQNGACPFGLAWREMTPAAPAGVTTWNWRPPYLPQGAFIKVAEDSDAPTQPMMFCFPGTTAPLFWPMARQNGLQKETGLKAASLKRMTLAKGVTPSPALLALAKTARFDLDDGPAYRLELELECYSDGRVARLSLPECIFETNAD